jgi:hypothetical protein
VELPVDKRIVHGDSVQGLMHCEALALHILLEELATELKTLKKSYSSGNFLFYPKLTLPATSTQGFLASRLILALPKIWVKAELLFHFTLNS